MWFVIALLSAIFAVLTSMPAKVGIDGDMQFFAEFRHNGELVHYVAIMDTGARTI